MCSFPKVGEPPNHPLHLQIVHPLTIHLFNGTSMHATPYQHWGMPIKSYRKAYHPKKNQRLKPHICSAWWYTNPSEKYMTASIDVILPNGKI